MHMYRWAGDASEWTEYAMHLPTNIAPLFNDVSYSILSELQSSGCKMWLDFENLKGREAVFLVFLRGAAGQPSNTSMKNALDMLSNRMKLMLPQLTSQLQAQQTQLQLFGNIGSNRGTGSTPPPPSFNGVGMNFQSQQSGPGPAWGTGSGTSSFTGMSDTDRNISNEDESTTSDEYYDPEDLARSLSLLGEGSDDPDNPDADWCTVPARRTVSLPSSRRPEPLRLGVSGADGPGGYVQRWLEIPRDSVGLVIGQGGKKIKDLCTLSGAKIQFRVNKTAEREGRPGLLELQGGNDNVDQGLQLVWDLLHLLGKEYQEVPVQRLK